MFSFETLYALESEKKVKEEVISSPCCLSAILLTDCFQNRVWSWKQKQKVQAVIFSR